MAEPCRLIELTGTPHDRGMQYGRQAVQEITRSVGHYGAQARSVGLDQPQLAEIVRQYLPALESFDPRQVEEMRGIARGAGISFEEIVLVNARTELLQFAHHPALLESMRDGTPDGCTGVVVRPGATRDKQLIHAHNWDWKLESAESCVVLRIHDEDGPDILTFTEAGALASASTRAESASPPMDWSVTGITGARAFRWRSSAAECSSSPNWGSRCARPTAPRNPDRTT